MRRAYAIAAAGWLLAAALPAAEAAEAAADASEPSGTATLEEVTVDGEGYDPRRDDAAARVVVSREELVRFGDTRLIDALGRLPGVTVGRGGTPALRGMANYTQVLVDGEPLPPGASLESIAPDSVERVEIRRVATADQRAEAIAGTINIVLRRAAGERERRLQVAVAGGGGATSPSATWFASSTRDGTSRSLNLTARRQAFDEGQRIDEQARFADGSGWHREGTTRFTGTRDALVATPRWSRKLDNGSLSFEGLVDASRFRKTGRFDWDTLAGTEPPYPRHTARTGLELLQMRGRVRWEHATEAGGRWTTNLSLYGNREDFRLHEQAPASGGGDALDQRTESELAVATTSFTGKYAFPAPEGHAPELGWDFGEDRRDETRELHTTAPATPGDDLDFDARVRRIAFYGQDDWSVSERWSLYLGARWERIATRTAGVDFDAIEQNVDIVSPIVQALWKPKGRGQLRLAFSRTYEAPELRLLIPRPWLSLDNSQLDPDLRGNPALRPELALGLDASWQYFRGDDITLGVGTYVRRIDDIVRSETRSEDGRWISSPVNGGEALTWGIEADGSIALRALWDDAPDATLTFDVARNASRLDDLPEPDNRLDDQPALSGSVGLDVAIDKTLTIGGSWRYRRYDDARTNAFQTYLASTTRSLDLYAAWRPAPGTRLRLGLGNVLGDDARSASEYRSPGAAYDVARFRALPRTFSVGFEHDF